MAIMPYPDLDARSSREGPKLKQDFNWMVASDDCAPRTDFSKTITPRAKPVLEFAPTLASRRLERLLRV